MGKKESVVTKKMIAFALTAPFIFSVGGMVIALFSTQNSPQHIRNIALIVATFVGLFVAIGSIFLIQRHINKKIAHLQEES
jgi:hypothetical protein